MLGYFLATNDHALNSMMKRTSFWSFTKTSVHPVLDVVHPASAASIALGLWIDADSDVRIVAGLAAGLGVGVHIFFYIRLLLLLGLWTCGLWIQTVDIFYEEHPAVGHRMVIRA